MKDKNENNFLKNAVKAASDKKDDMIRKAEERKSAAADRKEAVLSSAVEAIEERTADSALNKAIDKKFNSKKTSLRARIIRLGVISVTIAAFVFAGVSMAVFHSNLISSNKSKLEDLAVAYQSAVDNADILKNSKFTDNLFKNYIEIDENDSFGFLLNSSYVVFSETDKDIIHKNMNLKDAVDFNSGYKELYDLAKTNFDDKMNEGTAVIKLNGKRYMLAFAKSDTYDGFYIYVLSPYDNIMKPYKTLSVICVVLFMLLVALSVTVCIFISGQIAKPIIDVCSRLKMLAEGDVTSPAPSTDRNDETMILVNSLEETINSLHTYIEDIDDVLSGVANGDLLVESKVKYAGDFQDIRRCLDKILKSLNVTFYSVNHSADRVKQFSVQVSDGSSTLSNNASTDAATIEELTASMNEIDIKVKNNAEQAKHARELTGKANKQVTISSNSMNEMVVSIEEMQQSSKEIAKIIKVIDDIAFQTNILALNAAVEASKAGAAGKGFAVVADEVRNLATKSATAASQTGKLIKKSISSMDRSAELAEKASTALSDVVVNVKTIDSLVGNIAASAEEQALDIENVNNGMEQINISIQTTSMTAEESATASQELTGQSDDLNIIINKFKFKKHIG